MKYPWVQLSFPFHLGGDEHTCVQHSFSLHSGGKMSILGSSTSFPFFLRKMSILRVISPSHLLAGCRRAGTAHGRAPCRQIIPSLGGLHHPEWVCPQVLPVFPAPLPHGRNVQDACVFSSLDFPAVGPVQGNTGPGDTGREHSLALWCTLQPAQLPQAAPEGQSCLHHRYEVGMGVLGFFGGMVRLKPGFVPLLSLGQ